MKFTTSENTKYVWGVGNVPKPWMDYGLDATATIEKYFDENIKIWDADTCGDETVDFLFEDGSSYRLEYSWYLNVYREVDDEGEELPWVIDSVSIEEISVEANTVIDKKMRDWL